VAFLIPSLVFFVVPNQYNLAWAAPWFLGSFALGMWGAQVAFSPAAAARRFRDAPWRIIAVVAAVVVVAMLATGNADLAGPVMDGLVSVCALACILASVLHVNSTEKSSGVMRVLGSRSLVFVAGFSYSLYLLQQPILKVMETAVGGLPLSYDKVLMIQLMLGTPIVLAVAWLFSEFCERPFSGGGVLLPYIRRAFRGTSVARPAGNEIRDVLSSSEAPASVRSVLIRAASETGTQARLPLDR
jgi:peptidoglycan/LPS O-acetylase OafA/YrhL